MCKDTGFLGNGHKCNCLKQRIINEAYHMSNLSRVLHYQNFSTFDESIFSTQREDSSGVSPQENILEILS
ncbi:DNA replication protein DnaC, partial [Casaltella massiliensis]|nr:DNA replication protein DnaC [Casaltella massiliensis]